MSGHPEQKVADTRGRFAMAVKDGRVVNDAAWTKGRIILSNRRLVLVGNKGKRTIPLADVDGLEGRKDASQALARVSGYVSIQYENDVFAVAAEDHEAFRSDLFSAMLDQRVVQVKHPAVEGGVVTDATWEQARVKVDTDAISIALRSGTFVEIDLHDVGRLAVAEQTVDEEEREVLKAEHTVGETSVETHLTGSVRQVAALKSLLKEGESRSKADIDLDEFEREVLMALYSGVSPFEVPNFLGMDVDRVEGSYERLVELEVLEEVRIRREVTLKSRGRNIASEAMNEN
jgi:helix-turn-helix protein